MTRLWGTVLLLFLPLCAFSQDVSSAQPQHSPSRALVLSAIIPGSGQIYNHQAWKVPIVYAALGGIGYYTYFNYSQMSYYRDEYLYRRANGDQTQYPDNPDMVATPTSNIYNMYEAYNKTFQLSVILTVAVYGLNLIDAYVFGHLFDFQINEDLSLNMSPSILPVANGMNYSFQTMTPAASLTLRF